MVSSRVLATAKRYAPLLERFDPHGLVEPRSRMLCAGLAELALDMHRMLGGQDFERVGWTAAALSMVTKLDDQIIDAPAFHRGISDGVLRRRTAEFLEPTVDALLTGQTRLERCELAAVVGRELRGFERFEAYVPLVHRGLEVQVDAVATFTRHPSEVSLIEVERVTRDVSAVWLLLIAMVGALSARRLPTEAELDPYWRAGKWIQRVDALADLEKDLADGHRASFPLKRLWDLAPNAAPSASAIALHGIDRECVAPIDERRTWPVLLDAIHEHLHGRFVARVRKAA